jgi:deoxycytidylate deaminase
MISSNKGYVTLWPCQLLFKKILRQKKNYVVVAKRYSLARYSKKILAIYIEKYLKAKEELWKLKYFTMQKYNFQKKILLKKPKPFKISSLYN